MPWSILIAVALILIGLILVYFSITKKLDEVIASQKNDPVAQVMNQNVQAMHERLDKAAQYIGSLGQELRSMQNIGKNIDDLKNALFSPKLRGNFGERVLQDMLEAHFPKELFELQHKFKAGETVDAIIKTKDGVIPVDSKFPLENYRKMLAAQNPEEKASELREFQKAVKKHIGDIARKYILPGEGTTAFAIMYVPSEGVFYEILSNNDELSEYAQQQKVVMVSPNTMSYYLHVLRLGLERIRIEENVQKVWGLLAGLGQESTKFGESLSVLSRHVTNAKNAVDGTMGEYERLAGKIDQIRQLK